MPRIRVLDRGGAELARVDANPAMSVLNALLAAGVVIRHDCGGRAQCGTCVVRVAEGAAGLSPVGESESERLAAGSRGPGYRLACQIHASKDAAVEIQNGRRNGGEA